MLLKMSRLGIYLIAGALSFTACSQQPTAKTETADSTARETTPALAAGNLKIGDKLPDFELQTMEGKSIHLADVIDGEHLVAVIWHSPACPCARNCLTAIAENMKDEPYTKNLRMVGVASGSMLDIDWYQSDLKKQIEDGIVPFEVGLDRGNKVLEIYGAKRTPTVWLADKDGVIRFWGAPESTLESADSDYAFYFKDAVDDLIAGREVRTKRFDPIGCLIDGVKP